MSSEDQELLIITLVEKQKRGKHRYNIFLNEQYAFSVHEDIMVKHRLLKGEVIDQNFAATILQDEERNSAYVKALRMIGRRPHSSSEVKRKLKEHGFEQPIIQWTCDTLEQQNYINDEEFAKMWTESRVSSQRKGRNLVRQELQMKGINKELVKEAIETIDPEEEFQGALKLAQNKWKQTSGTPIEKKRKTIAFLMRRGFTSAVISKALSQIDSGQSDEEFDFIDESLDY